MKNICVIGTGISGATIANLLSKNFIVEVYDKAKGIGGRSSYRRYLSEIGFDHDQNQFQTNIFCKNFFHQFLWPYRKPLL